MAFCSLVTVVQSVKKKFIIKQKTKKQNKKTKKRNSKWNVK